MYVTELSRYVSQDQCELSNGNVLYNTHSNCLNIK